MLPDVLLTFFVVFWVSLSLAWAALFLILSTSLKCYCHASLHAIEPGHLICAARNLAPYKDCGDKFPPHLSLWWPMKSSQDSGPWFSNSHLHPLCSSKEERKKRNIKLFQVQSVPWRYNKKGKIIFVVSSLHNLHLKQFDVPLFNEIKHLGIWKSGHLLIIITLLWISSVH